MARHRTRRGSRHRAISRQPVGWPDALLVAHRLQGNRGPLTPRHIYQAAQMRRLNYIPAEPRRPRILH